MSDLDTLRRHCSHYLLGRVFLLALGFVSFPLFTRLFSVADYGDMNLIFKIVLCFVVVSKLGIQNSVVRFYEESVREGTLLSSRRYYSTLLFGTAGIGVLVTLVFVLGTLLTSVSFFAPSLKRILILASLLIVIRSQWSILSGFLQAEGRTRVYNVLDVINKAGSIAVICLLLITWPRSLAAFFTGTIVVEAAAAVVVIGLLIRRHVLHWAVFDWIFLRTVLAFGFPLVAYEIASVILDSGDRFLIRNYLGAEQLGYYSAAYNLSSYAQISLMAPINLALIPIYMKVWVSKGKEETQSFLRKSLDLYLFIAIGICCTVTLISRDLVILLASKKFESSYHLLPILIVGLFIYSVHIFLTAGLLIHKKTFLMARQVIYATVLNIGLNVILLPRVGVAGAAWATLLSYAFLIGLMMLASFRLLPITIDYGNLVRYFFAAAVTYGVISQIEFKSVLWGLALKGTLGVVMYLGLLWVIDRRLRKMVAELVHKPTQAQGTTQLPELRMANASSEKE